MSQLEAPVIERQPSSSNIDIDRLIASEMQDVNQRIQAAMQSDVVLINQMGHYIIGAGGKRLRPKLLVLSALAQGYRGEHHATLAAVIEFIHTATLLHDDVVDSSALRRGRDTANTVWGNEAAVLVGDFLYSRSFEMMVAVGQMRVMQILSEATNTIAEGEVMQLMNIGEAEVTEQRYMEVVKAKTGRLFEAATQLGSVLAEAEVSQEQSLAAYGAHLGIAFQLIDDILDYTASSEELGKNPGDDLAEGKPTLPLIYALQSCSIAEKQQIQSVLTMAQQSEQVSEHSVSAVVEMVKSSGAIEKAMDCANAQTSMAIDALTVLPSSDYKDALVHIAEQSTRRRF